MTTHIRKDDQRRVKRIARDSAEEFITSVDDLFSAYETIYPDGNTDSKDSVVGVGVYYFEADKSDSKFLEN